MAKLNIPANRKIFGCNIVPKKADIYDGQAWGHMILSWDWDNWIKPQIDLIAGNQVGCNAIRMIGEVYGIASGMYTQEFYDARWQQLADYCEKVGVYLYPCCTGKGTLNTTPISNDGIANIMITSMMKMQQHPNCIGIDMVQEANVRAAPADSLVIELIQRLKAGGITLPITCSTGETNLTSVATAPFVYGMGQYFDFIDVHMYTYAPALTMQSLDSLRAAFPDKDILVGEYGCQQSVSEDQRLANQRSVLDLMNSGDQRIRGGLRWAVTDQDDVATNMWGAYDVTFAPRLRELNLLRRYTGGSVSTLNNKIT